MNKQNVESQDNDQPATLLDHVAFLVSPWVLLTFVMITVVGCKAWDAEMAGLATLTPDWFMPGGAVVAGLGLLVSLAFALSSAHAPFRTATLALVAFSPAGLFAILEGVDPAIVDTYKTVFALFFAAGPWLIAAASWMDDRALAE